MMTMILEHVPDPAYRPMAVPRGTRSRNGMLSAMRILIVEPDDALRDAIALDAEGWPVPDAPHPNEALTARTTDEAIALLDHEPGLVIFDVRVGGVSGVRVLEAANERRLTPSCLAMSGEASAEEAFELGTLGVRGYLAKPFTLGELREMVGQTLTAPPDVEGVATAQVGHVAILTVQDRVKKAMLKQALAIADGNYVRAAKSLGVTRQAVQQMVRRYELAR